MTASAKPRSLKEHIQQFGQTSNYIQLKSNPTSFDLPKDVLNLRP